MDENLLYSPDLEEDKPSLMGVSFDWRMDLRTQRFECDSEAMRFLLGIEAPAMPARQLLELLPHRQQKEAIERLKQVLTTGSAQRYHCTLSTPRCTFVFAEFLIEKVSDSKLCGTITPLLLTRENSQLGELFYQLFENAHHGILVTDSETRILACNRYFEKVTGYQCRDLLGLQSRIFNADKHSALFYKELWQNVKEKSYWSGSILTRTANGQVVPQELTIQRVDIEGSSYYVGLSTDLSSHLNRINDRDGGGIDLLTQLPGKAQFVRLLEDWFRAKAPSESLVMLAIQPNLSLSTDLNVKREVAHFLRENATVSCAGYIGNDRFVVSLKIDGNIDDALVRQVRQVIKRFYHSVKQAGKELSHALTQGKTGVSVLGVDAKTPHALFAHANQALLEMHSGQQNHISFYDHSMHQQVEKKKRLEELVAEVIEEKRIAVHYQPIVNLHQWRIEKFEALCRFPSELSREASVQELIGVAEDLQLIASLDRLVSRKAMADLVHLQACFGKQIGITFNRSLQSARDVNQVLIETALLIDECGAQPHQVTVEITENAYFETEQQKSEGMRLLREAGVAVAIDDFGTGYSSLQYLTDCHFDVLKIDRAFVTNITTASNQYRIIKSLTELSHQLGLKVVAEGVETEQELEVLVQIGVDAVQGFLFSPPFALGSEQQEQFSRKSFDEYQKRFTIDGSISDLATLETPRLDPGDPISLAYEYLQREELNIVPVIDGRKCVGFVDREALNLHLTPTMGTELETMKEAAHWHKRVNQVMVLNFSSLNWKTQLSALPSVIHQLALFPWIMVDDNGDYKGVIEMHTVFKYLHKHIAS